jgi:hypothetical protein
MWLSVPDPSNVVEPDYTERQGGRCSFRGPGTIPITRAGFPAAITPSGIDEVTTLPAPITEPAPIVTP